MRARFLLIVLLASVAVEAAPFRAQELFRLSFGAGREALGTRVEGGHFSFPREFTIDNAGRFYVYDTHKHRIARYSPEGRYEMGFSYPPSARQVFAHADARQNLWMLVADPGRGLYYGVYDRRGQKRRDGLFSQFDRYRLHLDPDSTLQIVLSSSHGRAAPQTFIFHEPSLLMKKIDIPVPPERHHEVRKNDQVYYIDAIPGAEADEAPIYRILDPVRRATREIRGRVIYITAAGEIYARLSERDLRIYSVDGSLLGKFACPGLASSCGALRFDASGNLYQLDGLPNDRGDYTPEMRGMRMILWRRL